MGIESERVRQKRNVLEGDGDLPMHGIKGA